jgi:DNA polymerase-3 subunit alpha
MLVNADTSNIAHRPDRDAVTLAGIVSNIREVTTKRKDTMAYITLEDLKGSVSLIFFPDAYRNSYDLLHGEEPLLIKGTLDIADDSVKVIASDVSFLSSAAEVPYKAVCFTVDVQKSSIEDIELLRRQLKNFPGRYDGFIRLVAEMSETVIYLGEDMKVDLSVPLIREADRILGIGASQFQ